MIAASLWDSSDHGHTAVHVQGLTGHISRLIGIGDIQPAIVIGRRIDYLALQ